MFVVLVLASLAFAGDLPETGKAVTIEPASTALGAEIHAGTGHHLLTVAEGDGCPTMYRVLCLNDNAVMASFGNCSELSTVETKGETFVFSFAAEPDLERAARRYTFVSTGGCKVTAETK